jgi:hypothetical protein
METLMLRLIQLSAELVGKIDSCELEDMEEYMKERDQIFAELQQCTPTVEQAAALRPLTQRILESDTVITGRMTELYNEASDEIDKINKGKRSKTMYQSAYAGEDSLFFDTKQ